jgi:hypothetical protein
MVMRTPHLSYLLARSIAFGLNKTGLGRAFAVVLAKLEFACFAIECPALVLVIVVESPQQQHESSLHVASLDCAATGCSTLVGVSEVASVQQSELTAGSSAACNAIPEATSIMDRIVFFIVASIINQYCSFLKQCF